MNLKVRLVWDKDHSRIGPWLLMPSSREHGVYDGMWQPGMCVGSTREPI